MKKAEAQHFLGSVAPEQAFWVHEGPVVDSLGQLNATMKKLNPVQFKHHVTKDKNDFATWITDIVGDSILAKQLRKTTSRTEASKVLSSRVSTLKKHSG